MSAVKITEGIYSVGIQNPNMRVFDIVMKTDSGTTYNSYVVKGSEKTALIETCHEGFFHQYLENIKEVCPLEEIDYIIMNHNEPDHSGSMAKLLELMPKAKIIASQAGSLYRYRGSDTSEPDQGKFYTGTGWKSSDLLLCTKSALARFDVYLGRGCKDPVYL